MNHTEIIKNLGGTAKVARLCEVRMASVSEWKASGIPKARLMFLKAIRPDLFDIPPASKRKTHKDVA
jgi:hypothetical protein